MAYRQKMNFNIPTGQRLPVDTKVEIYDSSSVLVASSDYSNTIVQQPSVAVIGFVPTVGPLKSDTTGGSTGAISAIETAAMQYFAQVRSANTSLAGYTQKDLIKYTIATTALHQAAAAVEKAIRCLGKYNFKNYAFRGTLQRALWAQPDNALANYANIVARVNLLRKKLEAVPVMADVPFVKEQIELVEEVYADDLDVKSLIYTFMPCGIPYWNVDVNDPTYFIGHITYDQVVGGVKSHITTFSSPLKAEVLIDTLSRYLDIYAMDDDFNKISSEILKAFPAYKISLPALPEEIDKLFDWNPVFSMNMNDALRNAKVGRVGSQSPYIVPGLFEDSNGHFYYSVMLTSTTPIQISIYDERLPIDRYGTTDTGTDWIGVINDTTCLVRTVHAEPDDLAIKEIERFMYNNEFASGFAFNSSISSLIKNPGLQVISQIDIYTLPRSTAQDNIIRGMYYRIEALGSVSAFIDKYSKILSAKCMPNLMLVPDSGICYPLITDYDNATVIQEVELTQNHNIDVIEAFHIGTYSKRKA